MKVFAPYLLALLILSPLGVMAQDGGSLEFDAVGYRLNDDQAQVEVYYGIIYRALAFKPSAKGWTAAVNAKAEVRQRGNVVATKEISKDVHVEGDHKKLEESAALKLIDGALFTVPYSDSTEVVFYWRYPTTGGRLAEDVKRVQLQLRRPDGHFGLGDLELASDVVEAGGKTSPFEKVGFVITPNPSRVFGELYTKLYFYTELYVPEKSVNSAQEVDIVSEILDGGGNVMYTTTRRQSIGQPIIPYIGAIDIDGLPSGSYRLLVRVKSNGELEAEAEKRFFYDSGIQFTDEAPSGQSDAASEEALFASSDINKMSEVELQDRLEQAKLVASAADIDVLESAKTSEEKRINLYAFWRKRDGQQAPLSAYQTYYAKVAEVNLKYKYQKTPGWKTSRGRVILKYGEPTHEDLNPHGIQTRSYIIWQVSTYRGRLTSGNLPEFVFVDKQGGGNYVLVHSNVEGEISNPNWYTMDVYMMQ